jgi:addiction module HigA family antidote
MKNKLLANITPGEILDEDFLKPMGLSQYRLAKDIGVPARRINEIVKGERAITADTALRLGRFFKMSAQFWLNLQSHYDLEIVEDRLGRRLEREVKVMTPSLKPKLFNELVQSVKQAKAIERGELKPSRMFHVDPKNTVVKTRGKLGLSQSKFATLLGISQETLQNWEQGRREPTGPAKVLLKIASKNPCVLLEAA